MNIRYNVMFCFVSLSILIFSVEASAFSLSKRETIASCYRAGAVNPWYMKACSGLDVPTNVFVSCMTGRQCFEELPVAPVLPPGVPFCGAPGLLYCQQPIPCGYPGTIACPPPLGFPLPPFPVAYACGAPPYPPCQSPQACGQPWTLQCAPREMPTLPPTMYSDNSLNPTLRVNLPTRNPSSGGMRSGWNEGIQPFRLAARPVPDIKILNECRDRARKSGDKKLFKECVVGEAMPKEYRMVKSCIESNDNDSARAFLCSTGRADLQETYDKAKKVKECWENAENKMDKAMCVGDEVLDESERYYAHCITSNANDMTAALVCSMSRGLTPEQQIALKCAIQTGGEPEAFALCTGGQLLTRELDKCLEHGIGTDKGCFGPNNDLRKFYDTADNEVRKAFGVNSVAYQSFRLMKNNVLMPGPNHEFVRAFNTGLNDVKNGPGPNNDAVKAAQKLESGFKSVGNALGVKW